VQETIFSVYSNSLLFSFSVPYYYLQVTFVFCTSDNDVLIIFIDLFSLKFFIPFYDFFF